MDSISTRAHNGDVVITGTGPLDLYIAKEFEQRLYDACESADSVTVDLRSVEFIDSAIESRLARAAVTLLDRGKRLRVMVAEGVQPCRALKMMGIATLVDMDIEDEPPA